MARRYRLSVDEAEEFLAAVHLKFIENEYAVLRKFEGRSSLQKYIHAVVVRLFLDRRNAEWGKWRPSAAGRRHGVLGITLERLLTRDGKSFEEAVVILRGSGPLLKTDDELFKMSLEFAPRQCRRVAENVSIDQIAGASAPDDHIGREERARLADATAEALRRALDGLPAQNRLILKMRHRDRLELAEIARLLNIAQKPFYARVRRVYDVLREEIEKQGIKIEDVRAVVGSEEFDAEPLI